mgnify:CR=1 FL=1
MRHALALLLALAAAVPALAATPSRIEAEYRISSAGLVVGRVRETFVREGERYRIESITRSEGPLRIR